MSSKIFLYLFVCCIGVLNFSCKDMNTKKSSYNVGQAGLYTLTEDESKGSVGILINAPDSILDQYAPDRTFPKAVRAYMLKNGNNISLFDTGFGIHIFDEMDSVGVLPVDIQNIYLTHMHADHISGLLKDSKPTFPNAYLHLSQKEFDYWTSDLEKEKAGEAKKSNFDLARNVIKLYKDKLIIEDPYKLSNIPTSEGIHMVEAYGHTPGHVMYMIVNNDNRLLIWGDLMHVVTVQMPYPEIAVSYDVNPEDATKNRLEVLDYVSKNNIVIAGMHIPYGGIGTVNKENIGYSFHPVSEK